MWPLYLKENLTLSLEWLSWDAYTVHAHMVIKIVYTDELARVVYITYDDNSIWVNPA